MTSSWIPTAFVAAVALPCLAGLLVDTHVMGRDLSKSSSGNGLTTTVRPNCNNEDHTPKSQKEYVVITSVKANWFQAMILCVRQGRQLASVQNRKEEQQLIQAIMKAGSPMDVWLGAMDLMGPRGKYFWLSNGQPVNYARWNIGEPNLIGPYEPCLLLRGVGANYRWFNDGCFHKRHFACERSKSNTTDDIPVDWKMHFE